MNKVTWFEIPYDDEKRFQEFYKKVFGWEFHKLAEKNYFRTMPSDDSGSNSGGINGGFFKRELNVRHPMISIHVASIDEYFIKILDCGGKTIIPKMPIPEGGNYARFIDSEGNIIEIWEDKIN